MCRVGGEGGGWGGLKVKLSSLQTHTFMQGGAPCLNGPTSLCCTTHSECEPSEPRSGEKGLGPPHLFPLLDDKNEGWQEGGIGQENRKKEPSFRRGIENRNLPFLKVHLGAEVTGEIKAKGTYITRHCTYKDTLRVCGVQPGERCDTPCCFTPPFLPSAAWSHLVRQQAVGDRQKWHPAT